MIIRFNVTGSERKRLSYALGKITLFEPVYMGPPTFAYRVHNYLIDRTGAIECPPSATKAIVERIVELLKAEGFTPLAIEGDALVIRFPKEFFTLDGIARLKQLIENKATLFSRAFRSDNISLRETDKEICFAWFTTYREDGETKAYIDFASALCQMAENRKRIVAKPYDGTNDKFAMRLFLVQLGLKGEKYKQTRKILLRYLTGNSAWRDGAPTRGEDIK